MDEPLADLDSSARVRVCRVLDQLAHEAQVCVVVAEHTTAEFEAIADTWLAVVGRRVQVLGRPPARRDLAPSEGTAPAEGTATRCAEPLVSIRELSVVHGTETVVDAVSLGINRGDVIALCGNNGAGKSSLLQAIALPTTRGTVWAGGRDVHALKRLVRRSAVALVPENFDDLLFAITVAEECRRADQSSNATGEGTAQSFARLLGLDSASAAAPLLRRHPRDLSAGERLCLVMAIQLSAKPVLLLVDEPTRGLDSTARALVGSALLRAAEGGAGGSGSAVMFATHDRDFAHALATKTVQMHEARLLADTARVAR